MALSPQARMDQMREIVRVLERAWRRFPALRFCQLVANALDSRRDTYYVPDEVLLQRLVEYDRRTQAIAGEGANAEPDALADERAHADRLAVLIQMMRPSVHVCTGSDGCPMCPAATGDGECACGIEGTQAAIDAALAAHARRRS